MVDITTFITEARTKGLDDAKIKNALSDGGWSEAVIDAALLGLTVPQMNPANSSETLHTKQPSLSHLMAALQHVLLWFFTGSSIVTIIAVVASLSGFSVSSEVLASMIAVTLITFTPYAILFLLFLIKSRRNPGLIPGKVWSIITVCLHSIGAMAAAITAVVTIIISGESHVLLSASLILTLNLIMVITYCFAAFSPERLARVRSVILAAHLPVLLLLFGTLFIMSVLQLGPAKHDEQIRKDLTKTVQNINAYAKTHKTLPTDGIDILVGSDVTYIRKNSTNYQVCGTFQTSNKSYSDDSYRSSDQPNNDSYVYESQFYVTNPGQHCFDFLSSPLDLDQDSWDY